jgi:hypothetical protein
MDLELSRGEEKQRPSVAAKCQTPKERAKQRLPAIDIQVISAAAVKLHLRQKENICFITSRLEIDCELESHAQEIMHEERDESHQRPKETEQQWLERILPIELWEYADVFSREASNVLPPHRSYDHKIQLKDLASPESLEYSLLYNQSTFKLQETKRFLEENL